MSYRNCKEPVTIVCLKKSHISNVPMTLILNLCTFVNIYYQYLSVTVKDYIVADYVLNQRRPMPSIKAYNKLMTIDVFSLLIRFDMFHSHFYYLQQKKNNENIFLKVTNTIYRSNIFTISIFNRSH